MYLTGYLGTGFLVSSLVIWFGYRLVTWLGTELVVLFLIYRLKHGAILTASLLVETSKWMHFLVPIGAFCLLESLSVVQFRPPSVIGSRYWSSQQLYHLATNTFIELTLSFSFFDEFKVLIIKQKNFTYGGFSLALTLIRAVGLVYVIPKSHTKSLCTGPSGFEFHSNKIRGWLTVQGF